MNAKWAVWATLVASGCETVVFQGYDDCVIEVQAPAGPALPGDAVTLAATPATTSWDTTVRVGGVDATVLSVDRLDAVSCLACDSCRAEADCLACGTCEPCDDLPACTACTETVTFEVPTLPAGDHGLMIVNLHGVSLDAPTITILPDTAETDTDVHTDVDTDTDVHTDVDTDTDVHTDVDTDTDAHTDSDMPGATDTDSDVHTDVP